MSEQRLQSLRGNIRLILQQVAIDTIIKADVNSMIDCLPETNQILALLKEEVNTRLLNPHQVFLTQHPHLDNQILRGQIQGYEECRNDVMEKLE